MRMDNQKALQKTPISGVFQGKISIAGKPYFPHESIIGTMCFHFSVRNGKRWDTHN